MKTTQEYISLIGSHAEELKTMFGIRSLRIFGSVSRNEHKEGSDVDVCVDTLSMIRTSHPDVVLLDIIMPKMDGLKVLEEINKDGIYVIQ